MAPLPNEQLTVRVGCKLVYEVAAETPLLLDVQPHIEPGQTLLAEQLHLGAGLAAEPMLNHHGVSLIRLKLPPGRTEIVHDALVGAPPVFDLAGVELAPPVPPDRLPADLLRYVLPSRFCESDKLGGFAWQTFGGFAPGWPRVQAVSGWIHREIEYRFGSGHPELSAGDIFSRRFGVCRDFAHLTIALCRALNLPARYATGHLPDIGYIDPGSPMDFHAYAEVYLGGRWFPVDARYNVPRLGRVKISHGRDAVDCAFGTTFGPVTLSFFEVWAYQVEAGTVQVGDPIDLAKRLDGGLEVKVRFNG